MTDEAPADTPKKRSRTKRPPWWPLLKVNGDGVPYANEFNVMVVLENAEEFAGALQYDEFADQIRALKPMPWHAAPDGEDPGVSAPPWRDNDRIELQMWLQSHGVLVNKSNVTQDSVIAVAKRHGVHPLRTLLLNLENVWDQTPRLDSWLTEYLGASDHPTYLKAVGPAFLIGCVARVMDPGCQMDTILVLESPQGKRKSSVVRALSLGWNSDISHDLASKEAAILIQGVFICEMSELTALARSKVEEVKGFISRRKDRYRPPYGRNAEDRARLTVFIATTNEAEYLQDLTGARRFWPVDCHNIQFEKLQRDVEMLWAEAVVRWRKGERYYLPRELEPYAYREQEHRRRISPTEVAVMLYADRQREAGVTILDMRQVLREALQLDTFAMGPAVGATSRDVSRILQANGWLKHRAKGRGRARVQEYEYRVDRDPAVLMDVKLSSQAPSQDANKEGI